MIDAKVLDTIDELEAFQATRNDAWNIPRQEGLLLHTLVMATGAKTIVEVGTSYGFSGLFLASAARAADGKLHTFDIDPRKHEHAAANFTKAGLADAVVLHTGDARKELAKAPSPVDFLFIDAAKGQTAEYFAAIEALLAPRCAVAIDNTCTHEAQLREFSDMLDARGDFVYFNIPVGHGLGLAARNGQ